MPDYDFGTLSPADFERLAGDLLNADLGLHLRSYPEGRDQGIDLRQVAPDGTVTVVQCKHYVKSSRSAFLASVRGEARNPGRLTAGRYLFVTSRELSPQLHDEVAGVFGIAHDDVWARHALNDALGRNPAVERQHFKLWLSSTGVLESILNAGRWQRSDALLAGAARHAKYWVQTPAYATVLDTLEQQGVCVVAGPPGAGKTFLAEMVTLQAARDGWQITRVSGDIAEAWDALRPQGRQLFHYDDFLGEAELKLTAPAEAPDLLRFIRHVHGLKQDKRLIMTSREQVLTQAAAAGSDRLRQLTREPPRYAIALSTYGFVTRAEILFNHLYFSDLPPGERDRLAVDTRMIRIVEHPAYNPRLIETITAQPLAHATADDVLYQMLRMLDNPDELWEVSFDVLTPLAKQILLTLATLPPRPVPHDELRRLADPAGGALDWKTAVKSLEPTWVDLARSYTGRYASFANPGCRDHVLGRLDDTDLAGEQIGRIRRLQQLVSLTQSAGLLTADPALEPAACRTSLASALTQRRAGLARLIQRCTEEDLRTEATVPGTLKILRDATSLLSLYGSADSAAWLGERISELVLGDPPATPLPTADALSLAAWLNRMPTAFAATYDDLICKLIAAGLAAARTSRDLDAYEALPDELHTDYVHESARRQAVGIIDLELDVLRDHAGVPDTIRETALDLEQRAQWYGHEIHIGALLDHVDDLAAHSADAEGRWPEAGNTDGDPGEDPTTGARRIFSRFSTQQ